MTGVTLASARPASIPSPSNGVLEIGPLSIHAYGLMIALGVVAAVWLTGRRLEARGSGSRDDASGMAVWAEPANTTRPLRPPPRVASRSLILCLARASRLGAISSSSIESLLSSRISSAP